MSTTSQAAERFNRRTIGERARLHSLLKNTEGGGGFNPRITPNRFRAGFSPGERLYILRRNPIDGA